MNWESLFDEELDEEHLFSIWKKVSPALAAAAPSEEVLHEGPLLKADGSSTDFKERYFVLTPTHLFYKKVGQH